MVRFIVFKHPSSIIVIPKKKKKDSAQLLFLLVLFQELTSITEVLVSPILDVLLPAGSDSACFSAILPAFKRYSNLIPSLNLDRDFFVRQIEMHIDSHIEIFSGEAFRILKLLHFLSDYEISLADPQENEKKILAQSAHRILTFIIKKVFKSKKKKKKRGGSLE